METLIVILVIIMMSVTGFLLQSLSVSGSIGAILIGTAVYVGFGAKGLFLLGIFFATSSHWSKYKAASKTALEDKLAKGSIRDWRQVVANGGAAAAFSLIQLFEPNIIWQIGFTVCIASANSDTWASEIGPLSKKKPIYIRSFKRIDPGTSGAISGLGTAAAIAGSLLIALMSTWLFSLTVFHGFIIFLFGFLGNLIDTIIGAYYQQLYVCPQCKIETEKRFHCHSSTRRIKGISYMDNDMVNFLSGLLAAISAICLVQFTL
jgi:uncharacterized protein (TIGR00297 family)